MKNRRCTPAFQTSPRSSLLLPQNSVELGPHQYSSGEALSIDSPDFTPRARNRGGRVVGSRKTVSKLIVARGPANLQHKTQCFTRENPRFRIISSLNPALNALQRVYRGSIIPGEKKEKRERERKDLQRLINTRLGGRFHRWNNDLSSGTFIRIIIN